MMLLLPQGAKLLGSATAVTAAVAAAAAAAAAERWHGKQQAAWQVAWQAAEQAVTAAVAPAAAAATAAWQAARQAAEQAVAASAAAAAGTAAETTAAQQQQEEQRRATAASTSTCCSSMASCDSAACARKVAVPSATITPSRSRTAVFRSDTQAQGRQHGPRVQHGASNTRRPAWVRTWVRRWLSATGPCRVILHPWACSPNMHSFRSIRMKPLNPRTSGQNYTPSPQLPTPLRSTDR